MRSKTFDTLLARIRGEFKEMPGLRLTAEQGSRLWGLEREQCDELLYVLTYQGFLVGSTDGKYGRPTDCQTDDLHHHMAKAALTDGRRIPDRPAGRRAGER